MIGIAIPLSPILTISPLPDRWDGRVAAVREQFAVRPESTFDAVAAEEMRAAGWSMDGHRDHNGRLYGALPLGVARSGGGLVMTTKIGGFTIDICASCQMVAVTLGWHHDGGVSFCQVCMKHGIAWRRLRAEHRADVLWRWNQIEARHDVKAQIEAIASKLTEAA